MSEQTLTKRPYIFQPDRGDSTVFDAWNDKDAQQIAAERFANTPGVILRPESVFPGVIR